MYSMKFLALAIAFLFVLEFVSGDDSDVIFQIPSHITSTQEKFNYIALTHPQNVVSSPTRRYIKIRFRWERPSGMYYDAAYMEGTGMKMSMLKVVNTEAFYDNEVKMLRRLAGVESVAQLIDNWQDGETRYIVHGPSATITT